MCTRTLNANLKYDDDGADSFQIEKTRFVCGASCTDKAARLGQAYGHFVRVVDGASVDSLIWVGLDLFYVAAELLLAGWSYKILQTALRRLSFDSPGLDVEIMRALMLLKQLNKRIRSATVRPPSRPPPLRALRQNK